MGPKVKFGLAKTRVVRDETAVTANYKIRPRLYFASTVFCIVLYFAWTGIFYCRVYSFVPYFALHCILHQQLLHHQLVSPSVRLKRGAISGLTAGKLMRRLVELSTKYWWNIFTKYWLHFQIKIGRTFYKILVDFFIECLWNLFHTNIWG